MASVRSLKKDIDFLMSLVLQDCISIQERYPESNQEKVMEIAQKIIQDHRLLRKRVSRQEIRKDQGPAGKYLAGVVEEMYSLADDSLDQLTTVVQNESH